MTHYRLTALGLINALGSGTSANLPKLLAGDQSSLSIDDTSVPGRSPYVARVHENLPEIDPRFAHLDSRNSRLLIAAYNQIRDETERAALEYGRDRIGVIVGSSTSGIANAEEAFCEHLASGKRPDTYHYAQQEVGAVSEVLALVADLYGPSYTVSTACSSSAKVFSSARNLIASGICDAVLVGGADSLCRLTLNGFSDLDLLSEAPCNPFSANRKGITIGEGAALFLLERKSGGIQLLGIGESSDAYHMSSPDPQGVGAIAAMRGALEQAALDPKQVGYINLHGTGTQHNDAMEAKAVDAIFGSNIRASSTKPLVGHMLGASGATEVGFLWMVLAQDADNRFLPPHRWDGCRDEALPSINLVMADEKLSSMKANDSAMSTSFGFGGSNCAVVVGRRE